MVIQSEWKSLCMLCHICVSLFHRRGVNEEHDEMTQCPWYSTPSHTHMHVNDFTCRKVGDMHGICLKLLSCKYRNTGCMFTFMLICAKCCPCTGIK